MMQEKRNTSNRVERAGLEMAGHRNAQQGLDATFFEPDLDACAFKLRDTMWLSMLGDQIVHT